MPKSAAERQATYRQRVKARAGETVGAAVERERQTVLDEWIGQTLDDARMVDREPCADELAMLRDLKAKPPLSGEAFQDWFVGVINREVADEIAVFRKDWRRASRKRRRT